MNTDLTYTERADVADKRADRERIERIDETYRKFQIAGKSVGFNLIASANLAREIGLELQGIAGAEQMGFGFYTSHCAKDLPFDYEAVKQFISIAKRVKEPVKTVEDAVPVLKEVCLAQGLLTMPEARSGPQRSHAEPAVPYTFNLFGKMWVQWESRVKVEELKEEEREGVKAELDRYITKATEWRGKL